jgi:hypothetical protein
MINRCVSLAVLLSFPVTSCSDREPHWTGTISDSVGVTIVTNPEVGIWAPGEEWTLEEEIRIGAVEGNPAYQFGFIQEIAVGQDSRIYVLDQLGRHVKVFSPDGVFERVVGGPGDGPGELGGNPMFLAVLPGDTLIVFDAPRRINRYAPDGTSIESIPTEIRFGFLVACRATPRGSVAFQVRSFGPGLGDTDTLDAIVQFGGDRLFGDTLLRIRTGEMTGEAWNVYPREPVWTLTDDLDVVFGENHEYRLGVHSEGSLNRIISKAHDQRPVSDQEKEVIIEAAQRAVLNAGNDQAAVLAVVGARGERMRFADFVPPVSRVYIGPVGSLWVSGVIIFSTLTEQEQENYVPSGAVVPAPDWDVFDREGRFLGQVAMPPGFMPHVFRGDEIYGVQRGEFDVQYVVRFRVIRPNAS